MALRKISNVIQFLNFDALFEFEKIKKNDFRPDGHYNGRSQRPKIRNVNLIWVRV